MPSPPFDSDNALDQRLDRLIARAVPADVKSCRTALSELGVQLAQAFRDGVAIGRLVHARARCVDTLLVRAWQHYLGAHRDGAAMLAVGGYGRGELLPHSDIDLLLLYRSGRLEQLRGAIESLVAFLWDVGLQIGHSVRSPSECAQVAEHDATIITNLMEARLLAGEPALFADMRSTLEPSRLWPADAYFRAKLAEQQARHAHFDETAYQLEPNIKESPGGLRDIQTIVWVARRGLQAEGLEGLLHQGFLTEGEYADLRRGRSYLWRLRFALHEIAGRAEDRLLFDHQIKAAHMLGYEDRGPDLAVEQLMQRYYRTIKSLSALSDILLQLLAQAILHAGEPDPVTPLNARLELRRGRLAARNSEVFQRDPPALFELFRLMQDQAQPVGIHAETLRLLRRDRGLIDQQLRANPRCRNQFLDILRQGRGVTHALRQMNRYGVLGRYLPAFGCIIGRMQYDLFHTLTVDEHSLFVVRNLRRLALSRFNHELPFASRIMQALDKQYLLYIAGLFHDIAKGRGGDHSELGAEDAASFCADHGVEGADRDLVCWLVRRHLLMSMTAQRKDISDPAVIHAFAREVGSRDRLDRLLVFTVCDIRATNPSLWNSWRKSLLVELYDNARRSFARGLDNPLQQEE
ncbi:MAG: [protein-PII] uridylyltransferase, partial [Salinisphaera sp.]|nr:[protein-PII] uridylyltransferase [Salinisphaera sp.]